MQWCGGQGEHAPSLVIYQPSFTGSLGTQTLISHMMYPQSHFNLNHNSLHQDFFSLGNSSRFARGSNASFFMLRHQRGENNMKNVNTIIWGRPQKAVLKLWRWTLFFSKEWRHAKFQNVTSDYYLVYLFFVQTANQWFILEFLIWWKKMISMNI